MSVDKSNEPTVDINELKADSALLSDAIGGWRGILDSSLPTVVFLIAFMATSRDLDKSVMTAVASGIVLIVIRLARRDSLQQSFAGFFGLALSAYLASRTGRSEDFFLLGIVQNSIYAIVCLISVLLRRPLLGYIVSAIKAEPQSWRKHPQLLRRYSAVTWLWTLIFGFRVLITLPLYLANQVTWLGTAKLVLGTPLYVLGVFITFQIVRRPIDVKVQSERII